MSAPNTRYRCYSFVWIGSISSVPSVPGGAHWAPLLDSWSKSDIVKFTILLMCRFTTMLIYAITYLKTSPWGSTPNPGPSGK